MVEIEYLSPVWCQVNREGVPLLKQVLFYPDTYYRQGPFKKISKPYNHFVIEKNGLFLTGFLPRVFNFLKIKGINCRFTKDRNENRIDFRFESYQKANKASSNPLLLREEQKEAVFHALRDRRGVIHYPTGSGKTAIFLSIIEALSNINALILLHRQDLLYQTFDRAKEMFPGQVGIIGNGKVEPDRITIAMIQSMAKFETSDFHKETDIIIVDEAHHVSTFSGQYYNVLTQIPATMRLGFTATLPHTEQGKMALEGLIGPVIAHKTIQEVKSLAKPIIKLRKLPLNQTVYNLRNWKDVYKIGVVENEQRHKMVLEDAAELAKQGRTVLILIVEIEHGQRLLDMARKNFPKLRIFFVWGETPSESRNQIKKLLDEGKYDVVIASVVWREGIDIPSLGAIINACGGKSEIMTIQSLGRGLRTTEEKKDVVLIDYFDPSHHYLVNHFGHRITLYFEEGWL